MQLTIESALARVSAVEAKAAAYNYAMGVVYYDSATVAPAESAALRGDCFSALTEDSYNLTINPEMEEAIGFLHDHRADLSPRDARRVEILKEDYDRQKKIPVEEMMAYSKLQSESAAVWHQAKENDDFASFAPVLAQMVAYAKRFNAYTDPDKHPYDAQLGQFEKGMTRDYCDKYFANLKESLVPLIAAVGTRPQPDAGFLENNRFPVDKQRALSSTLMDCLTIDKGRCVLGETEHPFTAGFGNQDVRMTTHYYEDRFASSLYSVVHEGGHALYELGIGDELQKTCLSYVTSMAMHESQSRFFENVVGRSEAFCSWLLPRLRELFPGVFEDVTPRQLYCAVNQAMPSLIRTEADELTYSMHIMVRYEIEKALFSDEVTVGDLPGLWNDLYKQYLGVEVPNNRMGVLQDSHWSSGQFGYFPSYSIGSAYACQMAAALSQEMDLAALAAAGDLGPVCHWLRERMWKFGSEIPSSEVIQRVCGEDFNPRYYTDYLVKKFSDIYGL